MKKIILDEHDDDEVNLSDLRNDVPIFAKRQGKMVGMVISEHTGEGKKKWILRLGGECASNGWHESRQELLKSNLKYHFEFFVA